jgi:hypothetical protein
MRRKAKLMGGFRSAGSTVTRPRAVVLLTLVCCAVSAAPAAATSSSRSAGVTPASHVVLGSPFRPIRAGVFGVLTSGDYLLTTIANGFTGRGDAAKVINDRSGTTTALDPRCDGNGLSARWVLMSCPQTSDPYGPYDVELYSLADGTRQTVTPSAGVPYCASPPPDMETECASPDAVGAYWIRWDATCYHCGDTYLFQNIQTGKRRGDPTTATTFADLSSPALARKTCPGVRLMRDFEGYSTDWGSLTSYGQFALATGTDSQGNQRAVLERCGTRTRRLLASGSGLLLASNPRAILWQTAASNRLNGLFLPSLQTFTIPLPSAIVASEASLEGLTSGALYVRDGRSGTLWRTASPTALPLNTSRPRLTRSGSTMTCGRGSWRNAIRFSYAWRVNGTAKKAGKPRLALGKARKRRSVSCSVTASNAAGTTTASSAQLHVR